MAACYPSTAKVLCKCDSHSRMYPGDSFPLNLPWGFSSDVFLSPSVHFEPKETKGKYSGEEKRTSESGESMEIKKSMKNVRNFKMRKKFLQEFFFFLYLWTAMCYFFN